MADTAVIPRSHFIPRWGKQTSWWWREEHDFAGHPDLQEAVVTALGVGEQISSEVQSG